MSSLKDSFGENSKFLLLALALLVISVIVLFSMGGGIRNPNIDILEKRKTYTQPRYVLEEGYDYTLLVTTEYGEIRIDLYESLAPENVNSLLFLIGERYYEGLTIHKVIKNFVVQTGDAKGDGTGDPGYGIEKENLVSFSDYDVGMANASQFFIVLGNSPKDSFNGKYSLVGRVTEGFAVLESIQKAEVDRDYRPINDIIIKSIQIQEN